MCNVDRSLPVRLQWDTQFAVLPPEDKVKIAFKVALVLQAGVFIFLDSSNIHSHFSLLFFFPFVPFYPLSLLYASQTPSTLQLKSAVVIFTHRFLPSCLSFKGKVLAVYMALCVI